ncbi:MAG TPA: helix-turn-helix domain-containing protein [Candidatus Faecalibacterium gallistercoris]|uniref:Helix-turn-helix domain-containing protein n=1 Tax=Candidatus Faecalibacterium gallistercoris TaxID=2838579 RepID=A0A9D2JMP9_9FIRM|nr:helix-turn-helix domain-containing protein [Candidatus Faecalibacterium gallistercoris]
MQFNEKIISLRKSMGLSQEELGTELHVSRQTISKWESAQSYPDFQRLVLLSDYFGLTLDELVRDVDVADVRAKNVNNEKLDSIYSDINSAKKTIKWLYNCYLVVGGGIVALLLFFAFSAAFVW